jgi:hypothetical protein
MPVLLLPLSYTTTAKKRFLFEVGAMLPHMICKLHPVVGFDYIGLSQLLEASKVSVNYLLVDIGYFDNFINSQSGISFRTKNNRNGVDQFPLCLLFAFHDIGV